MAIRTISNVSRVGRIGTIETVILESFSMNIGTIRTHKQIRRVVAIKTILA